MPSLIVKIAEINAVFEQLEIQTKALNALKIEELENVREVEKIWADAIIHENVTPGKNDDIRDAQKRDLCPDIYAELDRIREEKKAIEGDLEFLGIRKEHLDYLLRWEGING